MDRHLLQRLRARRASIRREWETLLRVEGADLGHVGPEELPRLIDETLEEVFTALGRHDGIHPAARLCAHDSVRAECDCGRNPLPGYFIAGERALLEALIIEQCHIHDLPKETRETSVAELYLALREMARREVSTFCLICEHRLAADPDVLTSIGNRQPSDECAFATSSGRRRAS